MSDAKLRGNVYCIEETKSFGQKGFRKRTVVLEQDNGRFSSHIPVELIQDACDLADDLSVGDDVEVSYRLSGRKWQKDPSSEVKYFLSCEATSVVKLGGQVSPPAREAAPAAASGGNSYAYNEDVPF